MNSIAITTLLADDEDALRTFFDTARRPDIARAARDLAEAHRAAAAALEPAVLIARAFQAGQSTDGLLGALRHAASQVHEAASLSRDEIRALKEFTAQHREKHSEALRQSSSAMLGLEASAIPRLEKRIARYEADRKEHRERLIEAGIHSSDVDRAGLIRPRPEDRDEWIAEFDAARARVERLRAFSASGPLYDASHLLDGDLHQVV
ncbi:hypothetical protein AWB79_01277 [Caballeronia hypogeia]|uniref:Uncharacterized protein n=1 Tax=Caballeronia hypogeia TaxID=1777140 RepID=A0A157ZS45_9BURK|nr:hypothetical protein [Caballeronia hypogeia]SAK48315.1 hypothetical protein AWB79_01277 [Caballeronia hypogeia]